MKKIILIIGLLISVSALFAQTPLTIGGSFTAVSKNYDATNIATIDVNSLTLVGVPPDSIVSLSDVVLHYANNGPGTAIVVSIFSATLTGDDAASYYIDYAGSPTTTATIKKAPLTLTGTFTASNKVYDGSLTASIVPSGISISAGIVNSEVVNVQTVVGEFVDKFPGTGKTVNLLKTTLTGANSGNYEVSIAPTATANITKAPLTFGGVFTASNKSYNASKTASITVTTPITISSGIVGTEDVTIGTVVSEFSDMNIGTGKTVSLVNSLLAGADKDNYSISTTPTATANITAKSLTISGSFTAQNKVYDATTLGSIFSSTLGLVGVEGTDDVTLSPVLTFSDKTVGTGKTVSLTSSTLAGGVSGNYELSFTGVPTTTANITQKDVTIGGTFAVSNRAYNGLTSATISTNGLSLVGSESGDDLSLNAVANFSSKIIGTGKTVNLTSSTLTGTDNGNYNLSFIGVPTTTANITAKTVTISGTFTADNRPYDCTVDATVNAGGLSLVGVESGDVTTLNAIGQFATTAVQNGKTVSITTSTLLGADKDNYSLSFTSAPTATANITQRPITIGGSFVASGKIYDGNNVLTISSNNLNFSGIVCSEDVSINYIATAASKNQGSQTVDLTTSTLTGVNKDNYVLSFVGAPTTTATIAKKELTIGGSFTAQNKAYDGDNSATFNANSITLDGVVSSEDVTLTSTVITFASPLVANGISVSISSASLSGVDNGNYTLTLVSSPTTTANITAKVLTIGGSFTAINKIYNGNNFATFNANSLTLLGIDGTDDVLFDAVTIRFADKDAANGKTVSIFSATITGAQSSNYSLSLTGAPTTTANITKRELTIGGSFTALSKVYDATDLATINTNSLAIVNKVGTEDVSLTSIDLRFAQSDIGSGISVSVNSASLTGTDIANYTLSTSGSPTTSANITSKSITISGSFTANNKIYNANTLAVINTNSLSIVGVESGDVVTLTAVATFSDKTVGTGKTVSLTSSTLGGSSTNYSLNFTGAPTTTANITKKDISISGSFTANSKIYNGITTAGISSNSLSIATIESGDAVSLNAVANFSDKNVGTGKTVNLLSSTLLGADAANYNIASFITTTANITVKELTISGSFTVNDKAYDATDNASIVGGHDLALSGIVSPDVVTINLIAKFNNASIGNTKPVDLLSSTLGGTDKDNYSLTATNPTTTANITSKVLTIGGSFTANNKTYNASSAATINTNSLSLVGVEGADLVTLTAVATFSSKTVGNGKTVSLTSSTLGGASSNYSLSFSGAPTITANITKKDLTIDGTFTANSKTYNGLTTAGINSNSLSLVGVESGDATTLTALANFSDKNVGNGKTVNLLSSTLLGADAGNYNLTFTGAYTTTANITAKELTISGSFSANSKTYDAVDDASIVAGHDLALSGIVSPDVVTINLVAKFSNANIGNGKTVNLLSSTLGGADKDNYTLNASSPTTTANITAKTLTIGGSFTASNKTYNANASATINTNSLTLVGVESGDAVTLTAVATFSDKTVGVGKTVSLTSSTLGGTATNYSLSFSEAPTATATISKKDITISGTFTALNKTYNGVTTAGINTNSLSLSGVESGDVVSLSAIANFSDKNIGTGKTVNLLSSILLGTDAPNYNLTFTGVPSASANITAKELTISGAFSANNKAYDATDAATIIGGHDLALSGIVSPDVVTINLVAKFNNATIGNGKTVNLLSSTLGGVDKDNYTLNATNPTTTANITAKILTIGGTFTANNKTYNASSAATINTNSLSLVGIEGGDLVTLTAVATFSDKVVGIGKTVSLTSSTLGGASANYSLSFTGSPTTTATISKKDITVTGTFTVFDRAYNGLTGASINDNSLSLSGIEVSDGVALEPVANFINKNVGVGKTVNLTSSTLSGSDGGNYNVTSYPTTTASITLKELTISGAFTAQNKPYDGSTLATINGGHTLALVGVVLSEDVSASFVANFINENIGTTKTVNLLSSSLLGVDKDNYSLNANSPTTTANITAKVLTITGTFTANNKTYNATTAATINSNSLSLVGVESGDVVTLTAVANFVDKNVGTGKIVNITSSTIGGTGSGNYSLSFTGAPTATANIAKKDITISGSFTALSKVYDAGTSATINTTTVALSGVEAGDVANVALNKVLNFADKNIGSNKQVNLLSSTITGSESGNYNLSFTSAPTTTADITAKELTITGSFTANNKAYDGTTTAIINTNSLTLSGILASETVSLTNLSLAFAQSAIGTGITVSITGADITDAGAGNYTVSIVGAPTTTANITAKTVTITGTFGASNKTYDGNTSATISSNSLSLLGVEGTDDVTLTEVANFANKNIGTGKIVNLLSSTLAGADAANYSLSFTGVPTTTANITAKQLTITGSFTANNKTYDGNNSAAINTNSLTLSGVVATETVSLSSTVVQFASVNVANGIVVNVASTSLSGLDQANYTVTVSGAPSASANITAKQLTISGAFTASNKIYDGDIIASIVAGHNLALSGVVGTDDVTLTPIAKFNTKDIGVGKPVSLSTSSLGGTKAGNYSLNASSPTTTANITAKEITISGSFSASNKTYDGNTTASITSNSLVLVGIVDVEDVTLNPVLNFANANIGTGKIVNLFSSNLTGSDIGNYSLNTTGSPTATANITSRLLTISGTFTAQNKVYDGNTSATINGGHTLALVNVSGSDVVTLVPVANFVNQHVANGKAVNILSSTLSGAQAGNYTIDFTGAPATTANITAKPLTITGTFTALDKVYDATTTATINLNSLSLVGRVGTDDVTLVSVAKFATAAVGSGKTVNILSSTLGGALSNNYSLSFTGAPTTTASITAKALTITGSFAVSNKVYDGNINATITSNALTLVGIESGDVVTLTAVAKFEDASVGNNKPVILNNSTLGGANLANYSLSFISAPITYANITAQELTITGTFTAHNKVYDGNTDATVNNNSLTLSGLVSGDNVILVPVAIFNNKNVANNKPVTILTSTIEGTDAGNYTLSFTGVPSATANITQKQLTISGTFTAENKNYDGNNIATIATNNLQLSGVVLGDVVSLIGLVAHFAQSEVGNSITVSIFDATIVGGDEPNYTLTIVGSPTTTANITNRTLVIRAEDKTKIYGDPDPTFTVTYSGFISGEDQTNLGGTLGFDREVGTNIGNYSITPKNLTSSNYDIVFLSGVISITKKTLSIGGSFTAFDKNYDGTTVATIDANSLSLTPIVGTDNVLIMSSSIQLAFANATIGTGKTVSITAASLIGANALNYDLTLTGAPTTTASITDGTTTPVNISTVGNFINNGLFDSGTRKVKFNSTTLQNLKSNNSKFYDIEFNNTSGLADAITLVDNLTITNSANFTSGIIKAGDKLVVLESSATTNAGNANSFVDGKVQKTGASEFTLPTGHVSLRDLGYGDGELNYKIWAPIKYTPVSNAIVSVRYMFSQENLPTWWYHNWTHQAPLTHTSGQEYWLVESNANLTNVTLNWSDNAPCYVHGMCESGTTNFYPENLTVAYWDGIWKDAGGTTEGSSTYQSGSIAAAIPFIPFGSKSQRFITFGGKNKNIPLPVELLFFDVLCHGDSVVAKWQTSSEENNDYFTFEKSTDGINFIELARIQGAGNSNTIVDYSYTDLQKNNERTYYRISQTDFNGERTVYNPKSINCQNLESIISVMPNPFKESIRIVGLPDEQSNIEILDSKSAKVFEALTNNQNSLEIKLEQLSPGVYLLRVITKSGKVQTFKIVKN